MFNRVSTSCSVFSIADCLETRHIHVNLLESLGRHTEALSTWMPARGIYYEGLDLNQASSIIQQKTLEIR